MQNIKIEYIGAQMIITVGGQMFLTTTDGIVKMAVENLLVSLDRVGAINLSIEV